MAPTTSSNLGIYIYNEPAVSIVYYLYGASSSITNCPWTVELLTAGPGGLHDWNASDTDGYKLEK